ncbi:MAG: trehalose-6-phosphate synthase [Elusimicrobia bacterium]|nr:trehalose-6-phosphate synthase [Elusimicrobiota bacterium]
MKITLRLILSLIVAVGAVAAFSAYFQVGQERHRQEEELARRSRLLAEGLQETVEPLVQKGPSERLQRLVERFGNRERLAGVAVYDSKETPLAVTKSLAAALPTAPQTIREALADGVESGGFDRVDKREMHLFALPLRAAEKVLGAIVIFHETSYIRARLHEIWRITFLRVLAQAVLISLVTLLVVQWTFVGPIAQMAEWMKQLRAGGSIESSPLPRGDLFAPMAREVTTFARHLSVAKTAAEEEARLRQASESLWTSERLKDHVKTKLGGQPLVIVSNREPYMHRYKGREVEVIVPAGGVVTALDPLMRSCGGTWIAHGAGDADWDFVDERKRVRVPPDDPQYTLRRVALTSAEENGYYYGFSNEGLWPLCHIAHVRPDFRPGDWAHYQTANQKFADTVLDEIADFSSPCVLIQDYHFALLPRIVKEKRPEARIALFWHIPWPNPESFGICPWQKELLYGMLGADILGFHTQYHCNNFLETVDRTMECRIDRERFSVIKEEHLTAVKPFPISVDFSPAHQGSPAAGAPKSDRAAILKDLRIKAEYLGVGVDRVDYTKGILERFRAVERFLDKYPAYRGRFTFVQIGAPSRTHIKRYNDFLAETDAEADRINWKFKGSDWRPIVFQKRHHNHQEILPFYRTADLCMVTSLADGMNLVAKEFIAARDDEGGALVLSCFAGASRELRDALIVNPYDSEQTAEAIRYALEMPPEERTARMKRLRETVKENNIYRWAGRLITELTQVRFEQDPVARG